MCPPARPARHSTSRPTSRVTRRPARHPARPRPVICPTSRPAARPGGRVLLRVLGTHVRNAHPRYLWYAVVDAGRLMYVIDTRDTRGYLFRAPGCLARLFCRAHTALAARCPRLTREWGCAPTPHGWYVPDAQA